MIAKIIAGSRISPVMNVRADRLNVGHLVLLLIYNPSLVPIKRHTRLIHIMNKHPVGIRKTMKSGSIFLNKEQPFYDKARIEIRRHICESNEILLDVSMGVLV